MQIPEEIISPVPKTDDAVGVERRKWFIAIVNNRSEKSIGERLAHSGYEVYVPTQQETHIRVNGKKHTADRIVLPAKIFIHITEAERREVVKLSFINRFMTNPAAGKDQFNKNPIATVSDKEITTLRFMLENSDTDVEIVSRPFVRGDKVRIVRGKLRGLEGTVSDESGHSRLYVSLDILGCARMEIDSSDLEIIRP